MATSQINIRALLISGVFLLLGLLWLSIRDILPLYFPAENKDLIVFYNSHRLWLFISLTTLVIFLLSRSVIQNYADVMNKLSAEEKRYDKLVKNLPIGVYHTDEEGNVIYMNPAAEKICDISGTESINHDWKSAIHREDDERTNTRRNEAFNKSGVFQTEYCLQHKDGLMIWVGEIASPEVNDVGQPIGYMGTLLDITERKRMQEELRKSEHSLKTLMSNLPGMVYRCLNEPSWTMEFVSKGCFELTGYPVNDLLFNAKISYADLIHPDDRKYVWDKVQQALEKHSAYQLVYRIRTLHGDEKWVWEQGCGNFSDEKLIALEGFIMDITERKTAEEKTEQLSRHNELILNSAGEGIYGLDTQGNATFINTATLRMLQYDADELIGKNMHQVLHHTRPDGTPYPASECPIFAAFKDGAVYKIQDEVFWKKDGTSFPVEYISTPIKKQDELIGAVVVFNDISERRKVEKELNIANQIVKASKDFHSFIDKDYVYRYINDTYCVAFQKSKDEIIGHTMVEVFGEEFFYHMQKKQIDECLAGNFLEFDSHLNTPGFGPRDYNVRFAPSYDSNNKIIGVAVNAEDITEKKFAEMLKFQSDAKLDYLMSSSPTVLYALRIENNIPVPDWVSGNITRIFGYTEEEALKKNWWSKHLHPDDREHCLKNISLIFEQGQLKQEYHFLHKDGKILWVRDELRVMYDNEGKPSDIIGSWSDITEERQEREKMRLYAASLESTHDGVMITDLNSRILSINSAIRKITGYSEEELIGKTPGILQSGRHDPAFYQKMWFSINRFGFWQGEIWNRRKDGEIFPQWVSISVVYDDKNDPSHYVAVYTDITKLKQTEQELEQLAHFDALTNLPNRLLLYSRLEHAIGQATRRNRHIAVLFIDLDNFKKVNDSLGHTVGDELIVTVAERISNRVREEDTLGRLGGDEFLLLLENIEMVDEAVTVTKDILAGLSQPFKLPSGHEIYSEASIGISIFPNDGVTAEELLRNADTAMYRSKNAGRNTFSFFKEEMGKKALEELELETCLRHGIEQSELLLHFQPKVDLHTGKISGSEALIRWNSSKLGLVPPLKFIPIAERTGLIVEPIGTWIIETACTQIKNWQEQGFEPVNVAINISVHQFHQKLEFDIQRILGRYDIKPDLLGLEITESALMEQPDVAIKMLQQLKQLGLKISLDDFGTGYSNMAYLNRFPLDILKIDGSFIRNIDTDPSALNIVNTIINLAHSLGLTTVAEGVETIEQLDILQQKGCDEIQGYYFSKPVPPNEFSTLLRDQKSIPVAKTSKSSKTSSQSRKHLH